MAATIIYHPAAVDVALNFKRGPVNFRYGVITTACDPAVGWSLDDAGEGGFQELDVNGDPVGDPETILNRYFNEVPVGAPAWVIDGVDPEHAVLVNAGCTTHDPPE